MSFMNSRPQAPPARPQSLYFAYGSNLQLKQMAKRCPDSQFQGRARLHNFRWQINDRGFANVVPDPNSYVEGLCYLLSDEDEERLDRSEGVPTAYQKKWTEVEFYPGAAKLLGRRVTEILRFDLMGRGAQQSMGHAQGPHVELENTAPLYRAQDQAEAPRQGREVTEISYYQEDGRTLAMKQTTTPRRRGQSVPARNRHQNDTTSSSSDLTGASQGESARVLVYLSQNHIKEGLPWDEYVERMNWGIIDAVDLGISRQYIEKAIAPFLERATGFHANGEPRGRGVREKKKRSRHVTLKKQRRSGENEAGSDHYSEQTIGMQTEPMNWETNQDTQYHEYQGS